MTLVVATRDTSAWKHAIIQRKVINHDTGGTNVMCAWDTCEKDGYELYKVRTNDAAPGYEPKYYSYIFCCERHKMYWLNNTRPGSNNNLPSGYKRSIL